MRKFKRLLLIILVFHFSGICFSQEEWSIPDRKKKVNAPFFFTRTQVKEGKEIYYKNCASCHGDIGMNNYKALVPIPNDLSTEVVAANTDGELFYKINTGRSLMPQFNGVLHEMDIWKSIAYIRSFHPEYINESGMEVSVAKFEGDSVIIESEALKESKRIKLRVLGMTGTETYPLEGVAIGIWTPRLYGDLLIGNIVETDEYGFAFVDFPAGLPGDNEGMLELKIMLDDVEIFGEVMQVVTMKAGAPSHPVNILEGRHLWSTRENAPLWLLISFFGIILLVWGTIFYIIIRIGSIRKLSA